MGESLYLHLTLQAYLFGYPVAHSQSLFLLLLLRLWRCGQGA